MPWQQYVVDVALEIDPATGLPAYREVGMTVPRQQGKTLLILAVMVHRALGMGPPHGKRQNIIYTAQTGAAARTKFEDDHLPILKASPLGTRYKTRLKNGSEAMVWTNGSKQAVAATTDTAAHGETLDLGLIDEAFAHVDDTLEKAFRPAMMTRANAQMWWLSTAGTAKSLYLLGKVAKGRKLVEAGVTSGVAHFEWSADPKADPADPATWFSCMPALCPSAECRCDPDGLWHHTVTVSTVAADRIGMMDDPGGFRRGYLNIADVETGNGWDLMPEADWLAARDPTSQVVDPVCFAMATNPARTWGSISVCGRRTDGMWHAEVVDRRPGAAWLPARAEQLLTRWPRNVGLVVVASGPAGALIADTESRKVNERPIEVIKASVQDFAKASGQLQMAVSGVAAEGEENPRRLRFNGAAEYMRALDTAVQYAQKHETGDVWTFDRDVEVDGEQIDSSPVESISMALWGFASFGQLAPNAPATVSAHLRANLGGSDFFRPQQRLKL